jgi:hypothetical protein
MNACGIEREVSGWFPTLGHFTPLPGIIARIEGPSMGNFLAERDTVVPAAKG